MSSSKASKGQVGKSVLAITIHAQFQNWSHFEDSRKMDREKLNITGFYLT